MSKEQGFLGNVCQPRVSQYLSCILTEYDDGCQVNIPGLIESYIVWFCFRISECSKGHFRKKSVEGNP